MNDRKMNHTLQPIVIHLNIHYLHSISTMETQPHAKHTVMMAIEIDLCEFAKLGTFDVCSVQFTLQSDDGCNATL